MPYCTCIVTLTNGIILLIQLLYPFLILTYPDTFTSQTGIAQMTTSVMATVDHGVVAKIKVLTSLQK